MITAKDIKYQRHACRMQPYISNVFVLSLFMRKELPVSKKNLSICAFGNAVF